MASPNSYPHKSFVVNVEKKEMMIETNQWSRHVLERTISMRPSFALSVVPTREMMGTHPTQAYMSYACLRCKREFSSPYAVGGHQIIHKKVHEMRMHGRKIESPYDSTFHGYSHDAFNFITGSFNENRSNGYPWFNGGVTRGNTDMTTSMITHATPYGFTTIPSYASHLSQGLSFDPFKYGDGGSSMACPLVNSVVTRGTKKIRTTMFPPLNPNHFLIENTGYSSHASPNGNHINNSLGLFKSTGSRNNLKNVSSYNWGVTRGTKNMKKPKRPRNRNVAGNSSSSASHPPPPPSPTTRHYYDFFALQENGSGSKGKNKIVKPADLDEKKPNEAEAKSWGRDLTLFD